jgi:hypothetical protein
MRFCFIKTPDQKMLGRNLFQCQLKPIAYQGLLAAIR